MSEIKNDLVVEIEYTLTDDEGKELDSSKGGAPLAYIHGKNNIIPGLEKELTGKKVGDSLTVKVTPEEGYGEFRSEMIQKVPKTQFDGMGELQIGAQFQVGTEQGENFIVTVSEIEEETVTLNGNHPLAGMNLNFEVKVVSVREATEEELAHGHIHAHGEGCGGH